MPEIKQIAVNGVSHDIAAKYIQNGTLTKTWEDIEALVQIGFEVKVEASLPQPVAPQTWEDIYNEYRNCIVLIADATSITGTYIEYVIIRSGSAAPYSYAWERIGTTQTDLSNYVTKGTYTSSTPSTNSTGSAGAATYTTTSNGSQTATGSATITFPSTTITSSSGGASTQDNTGSAGAHTINGSSFSFTGTTATFTPSTSTATVKVDHHVYQPAGSIGGSQSVGNHSHSVTTHSHNNATVLLSATFTPAAGEDKTVVTTVTSGQLGNVMYSPTVSSGVLSWSTASVINAVTPTTATIVAFKSGGQWAASTIAVASVPTTATLNTTENGSHTINGSNFTFTGTTATLKHGATATAATDYTTLAASVTMNAVTFQPAGTIGGSVTISAHSHTYQKPADHTHTITIPVNTLTGSAAVAVVAHTHEVTVADHTHSLNNHTHDTTL